MITFTHLLRDQRGASSVQMVVLVIGLALGGVAGVKVLSRALGARTACAGLQIQTLEGAVPCSDNGAPRPPAPPVEPSTPPAQPAGDDGAQQPEPPADTGDQEGDDETDPEEFDPAKELLDILADIIGLTDAIDCVTKGDIVACAFTVLNFTPGKIFGLGFKLIANANKIRKAVERFLAARKAKKAEEEARKAEEAAERAAKEKAEREAREKAEKEARERAEKVQKCEAAHATYKALNCRGCRQSTTRAEVDANIACLNSEIAGRSSYLSMGCDFVLDGSIQRGSAVAEAGHRVQLTEKTNALNKCVTKRPTLSN